MKNIRGTTVNTELKSTAETRDIRTSGQRIGAILKDKSGGLIVGITLLSSMFLFPEYVELIFFIGMGVFFWLSTNKFMLPFRLPATSELLDHNDPKPGTDNEPGKAAGIAFLGNEIQTNKELWFTADDMKTHLLVFGSTGAGKALRMKEPILTPKGWVLNKDIQIGNEVINQDGVKDVVLGVFPQGMQSLLKIIFEDLREIEVTEDHLWEIIIAEQRKDVLGGTPLLSYKDKTSIMSVSSSKDIMKLLTESGGEKVVGIPLMREVNLGGDGDQRSIPNKEMSHLLEKMAKIVGSDLLDEKNAEFVESILSYTTVNRMYFLQQLCKTQDATHCYDSTPFVMWKFYKKEMAEVIQRLAWSLGWVAELKFSDLHDKGGYYELIINKNAEFLRIKSIEETNRSEECQCIKIANDRGLFVTKDWLVTHNTESLISMAFNTLVQGSGFIYVDGKGDNSLWAKIFAVCRSVGREDDLLVINYMTGGRDVFGPQKTKLSNTMNPFISGSAGGLTELLVGLMDEAGGDNAMWKGRAISLVSGIMMGLVWLRDNDGLLLDVDVIRDYLILDNIQKLAKRRDLPSNILSAIKAYLKSLPGYQDGAPKQSETVMDQHGYLQMQFTKILGSLSDTYGYIFRTQLGEVDFFDVVVNRRILIVLLPALEKSIDELGNLGKIVVACLKSMMATGLGDSLEGTFADVIDIKPTSSPSPYMCILDEYGYYVVKGAAVMPAQARSLGFSMVFAGQDYPAFKKNNMAEEAVSTIGNCNIKIFMKVEDPTETFDLFKQSVGEALVAKTSGFNNNTGVFSTNYMDGNNAVIEKRSRGDLLDLKDQRPGQAHIIFKSTLVRAEMFYAAPKSTKHLQLNHFLRVVPPHKDELAELDDNVKELQSRLLNKDYMRDIKDSCSAEPDIQIATSVYNQALKIGQNSMEASITTLGSIYHILHESVDTFKAAIDENEKGGVDGNGRPLARQLVFKEDDYDDDDYDDDDDDDDDGMEIIESKHPFLNENNTRKRFQELEMESGVSQQTASERTNQIIEDMRKAAEYPQNRVPDDKSPDDILDVIKELESDLDDEND